MNRRRLFLSAIAVFCCVAFIVSGCGQSGKSGGEGTIKIGFFGPLSGDAATDGVHGKNAAQLAIDEANAAGGINGTKLELVAEDDQAKPQEALKAVQKLITTTGVDAVMAGSYSTPVKTVAPTIQSARVPMTVSIATHPAVTEGGKYIFQVVYTGKVQGASMASFVIERQLKKFIVFYDESDYGITTSEAFAAKLEELGGKVVAKRSFKFGEKDFNPLIALIKQQPVDGVYVVGYYNEAAQIVRQAREQGVNVPFFGVDGFDSPKFLELGGDAVNGVIFSTSFSTEDPRPIVQNFVSSYKQKYGELPSMVAAQAYDATRILIEAIKKAGSRDKEAIRNAIAEIKDFDGVTGKISSFNSLNQAVKPIVFIEVKDGKFTFVKSAYY